MCTRGLDIVYILFAVLRAVSASVFNYIVSVFNTFKLFLHFLYQALVPVHDPSYIHTRMLNNVLTVL